MNFIKQHWLFLVLAAFAGSLAFLWFQAQKESRVPKETPLPTLPQITYPLLGDRVPNTSINIIPGVSEGNAKLYSVVPIAINHSIAVGIAQKLGFTTEPETSKDAVVGTHYFWTKGASFLIIAESPVSIDFGIDLLISPPLKGVPPTPQEAKTKLISLLNDLGLNTSGFNLLETTAQTKDSLQKVGFVLRVEQNPVVTVGSMEPTVSFSLDAGGKIYKFSYTLNFSNPQEVQAYPIKTKEEIIKTLPSEGIIAKLGETEDILNTFPTQITIETVKPVLLHTNHQPNTLFPIFVLEGKAFVGGETMSITIYTPSVKSNYINSVP